jgi:hypothetical protein
MGNASFPTGVGSRSKQAEDAVNRRFVLTLLTLLALVLAGTGPAAAQVPGPSFTVILFGCLIDIPQLTASQQAQLPEEEREAIITSGELDTGILRTEASIACAQSATATTAEQTCQAFFAGKLRRNSTTIKNSPAELQIGACLGDPSRFNETIKASNSSLELKNHSNNLCQEVFAPEPVSECHSMLLTIRNSSRSP